MMKSGSRETKPLRGLEVAKNHSLGEEEDPQFRDSIQASVRMQKVSWGTKPLF